MNRLPLIAALLIAGPAAQAAEYRWNCQDNAATTTVAGTIAGALDSSTTSAITTTGPGGSYPAAFALGGSREFTVAPDGTLNGLSSAVSVAWWMNGVDYTSTTAEQFAGIFCKDGGGAGDEWAITLNSGTSLRLRQNNATQAASGSIAGTGAWHHYAMVYNGTTVQFYQDGSTLGSATTVTVDFTNTQTIYVGLDNTNGRNLKANIAGVYISDTALNGAAISALYAEGSTATSRNPLTATIPGVAKDPLTATIPGP